MKWQIEYRTSDGDNDTFTFDSYGKAEAWLTSEVSELLPTENVVFTDRLSRFEYNGEWVSFKRKYSQRRNVRGYSLVFEIEHLDWDAIHKADKIGGFIECIDVNDDGSELISWHNLKWRQVPKAQKFMRNMWGVEAKPFAEYFCGSLCECVRV